MSIAFNNKFATPPGGLYVYELNGQVVSHRSVLMMEALIRELHAKFGIPLTKAPEYLLAEQMCPQLPNGFCSKAVGIRRYDINECRANALPYYTKPMATRDVIEQRLAYCVSCPKNDRMICLTCTGLIDEVKRGFGGRREKLPQDAAVSVCLCAKTLGAVVSSVEYTADDPVWEGTPDTCWRKKNV